MSQVQPQYHHHHHHLSVMTIRTEKLTSLNSPPTDKAIAYCPILAEQWQNTGTIFPVVFLTANSDLISKIVLVNGLRQVYSREESVGILTFLYKYTYFIIADCRENEQCDEISIVLIAKCMGKNTGANKLISIGPNRQPLGRKRQILTLLVC